MKLPNFQNRLYDYSERTEHKFKLFLTTTFKAKDERVRDVCTYLPDFMTYDSTKMSKLLKSRLLISNMFLMRRLLLRCLLTRKISWPLKSDLLKSTNLLQTRHFMALKNQENVAIFPVKISIKM